MQLRLLAAMALLFAVIGPAMVTAQEATGPERLQRQEVLQAVAPTERHRWLWQLQGEWTLTMKDKEDRGGRGTAKFQPAALGNFVTEDLEFGGGNLGFRVHAVYGYNPIQQRYTGQWFTSFSNIPFQGTADPDADLERLDFQLEHPLLELRPERGFLYRMVMVDPSKMRLQVIQVDASGQETVIAEFLALRSQPEAHKEPR